MSVWTVIVNPEDHDGYFARKMYGPPDRGPAWDQAVAHFGQELSEWPIAMFKGDFAHTVVTESNKEEWSSE